MTNNQSQQKCIGVLTSGGDAPGMNAAVRAVVRTALHHGAKVFVIKEGYKGLVEHKDNGKDENRYIEKVEWDYVSGIIHKGGTKIGTARWDEFQEESGQLKAARNLVKKGINRLIVIGGGGSLAGADEFHRKWPELLGKMPTDEDISDEKKKQCTRLAIVGLAGSIDNDMCGTDITIGADTALHRISSAVDSINSTAASHHRIFVVKVMGRNCGYLAVMGALITGADWVIIPEASPVDMDWKQEMLYELKIGMKKKRAIIVILAEGVKSCTKEKIGDKAGGTTAGKKEKSSEEEEETTDCEEKKEIDCEDVAKVLREGLKEEGETDADVRITILGHVQRGGSPSAFDRNLSTLLGHAAVERILVDKHFNDPCIVGIKGTRIEYLPLKRTIDRNKRITESVIKCDPTVMRRRGTFFNKAYEAARILMKPENLVKSPQEKAKHFAILHAGAPAPGVNAAVRAAVRLGIYRGYKMLGVKRGFEGLIKGDIINLSWHDVNGWASMGGSELGTSRKVPDDGNLININRNIKHNNIQGLLIIGGWFGYIGALRLAKEYKRFKCFNIPIICMPATIDNNLPGTEVSIGCDTALNNIVYAVDRIKQSAVAAHRCFVVEVMGRYCGYLALMSGLAAGAERVYLHEEKVTLKDLRDDLNRLLKGFRKKEKEMRRRLALVIRNEKAYSTYDTSFMTALFHEEGKRKGDFDARPAILGHLQQGGNPSPFDRILATKLADDCINFLIRKLEGGANNKWAYIGLNGGRITFTDLLNFEREDVVDKEFLRAKAPWWLELKDLATLLAGNLPHNKDTCPVCSSDNQ